MILNLLFVLLLYYCCRIAFYFINISYYPDMTFGHFRALMKGGFLFDISAIAYTNCLYILLQSLPFDFRQNRNYQMSVKWLFIIVNSLAIALNFFDIIYFRFANRRTTLSIFSEFGNENNGISVIADGMMKYWHICLIGFALIFILYKLYRTPYINSVHQDASSETSKCRALKYFSFIIICLVVFIGMRGGLMCQQIRMSNANVYADKSAETAIVLNTPFCMILNPMRRVFVNPKYFPDETTAETIYSPIHTPHPPKEFSPMNVVIIIVESFGKEYSGFFNRDLQNGTYKGYTPFMDSLYNEGLTFKYSYCNGRKSIDAMPSVLSSIPMFIEPFLLTRYSSNEISGIAEILREKGYYSAFFHGAPNGSLGLSKYARKAGFDDYFGMNDYGIDSKDFDGYWAIWDEEFLQFYAKKMGEMKQPFVTAIFTASSHHPFHIPVRYNNTFSDGTLPIHKCIKYTDYSLRRFFETMKRYEWFENTLFVLTADHTSQTEHDFYMTDVNSFAVPVLFYRQGSDLKGLVDSIPVQQIDIMPSILSLLGYDKPYFAFGQDIFNTNKTDKFAVNYNNQMYQIFKNGLFMRFDGERTKGIYDWRNDVFLKHDLTEQTELQEETKTFLEAMIQVYVSRMEDDKMR
jgi:phosphoglycerol transferase MdoB-like AlkP superfamily enzyme